MFHIIAFFIRVLSRLYVRVGILLICGIHLHDVISLLRREVRAHNTCLIPPLVIEVSAPSLEITHICLRGIDIEFTIEVSNCSYKGVKVQNLTFTWRIAVRIDVHGHEKIRCFDEWSYFYSWKYSVYFDSQYKSCSRL